MAQQPSNPLMAKALRRSRAPVPAQRRPTPRSPPSRRPRRSAHRRRRRFPAMRPAEARSPSRCWSRRRRDRPGRRRRQGRRPIRSPALIAATSVPSPPSGLPPQAATRTSSPTISRTMSAAPFATSAECETITMATLPAIRHDRPARRRPLRSGARSTWRRDRDGRSSARRGTRRGPWSRASARSPPAPSSATARTFAISAPGAAPSAAPACSACRVGTSTSSMVFSPTSELAALLDRLDALAEGLGEARGIVRHGRLAHRHEQAAVERPGSAADLHHEGLAGLEQGLVERQRLRAPRAPARSHRSRAAC